MSIAFALYFFRQKRIVSEKNHALVRIINENASKILQTALNVQRPILNDQSSIFNDIDVAIRSEQLYKDVNLQRQDICERFGISRHTLNDLMAEYADGLSFPQYVNNIRLEKALCLLRDEPTKTVSAISTEVGFTPANLREQFKRKYGMTPLEFRQNQ